MQVLINNQDIVELFSSRRALEDDDIPGKISEAKNVHQTLLDQIADQEKSLKVFYKLYFLATLFRIFSKTKCPSLAKWIFGHLTLSCRLIMKRFSVLFMKLMNMKKC